MSPAQPIKTYWDSDWACWIATRGDWEPDEPYESGPSEADAITELEDLES